MYSVSSACKLIYELLSKNPVGRTRPSKARKSSGNLHQVCIPNTQVNDSPLPMATPAPVKAHKPMRDRLAFTYMPDILTRS